MIFNSNAFSGVHKRAVGSSTAIQVTTVFASDMCLREMIRCAFLKKDPHACASSTVGGVDPLFKHKAGWRERVCPPMSIVMSGEGMSGVIWYICIICFR